MAIAMLIMFLYTDRYVILLLSWTIGISVAVLLTVPYVLVGKYHLNTKVDFKLQVKCFVILTALLCSL